MMKRRFPPWDEWSWVVESWQDIDELLEVRFDELRYLIYGVYLLVVVVALFLLALGIATASEVEATSAVTLLGLDGLVLVTAFYLVAHI